MAKARRLWLSAAPHRYEWTVHRSYFAEEPTLRITVADEVVTAVKVSSAGQAYGGEVAAREDALSVSTLFDRLDQTLQEGDTAFASFDSIWGYPRAVTLNSRLPDGGDGFLTIDFRPL